MVRQALAARHLTAADYVLLYSPLIIPFVVDHYELAILTSLALLTYNAYAAVLVVKTKHLRIEDVYLVASLLLIGFQIAIGNRLGFNSSLSLVAMVVVYRKIIATIGFRRSVVVLVSLYLINVAYMAAEVTSQIAGIGWSSDLARNSESIVDGLLVGSSLYMQQQAGSLVTGVALAGSVVAVCRLRSLRLRMLFTLSGVVSLLLAVVNIRGTSLVSFVVAGAVVAMITFIRNRSPVAFAASASAIAGAVMLQSDQVVTFLGFRFVEQGAIDERKISTYTDMFLNPVQLWLRSPVFNQLIGQKWSVGSANQESGDFAFGNLLYYDGLIMTLMYAWFVAYQCVRTLRLPRLSTTRTSLLYFNLFALVTYFVSLIHYQNATAIGIANLMAFHIAFNIGLIREASQGGAHDEISGAGFARESLRDVLVHSPRVAIRRAALRRPVGDRRRTG